ncbi:hypothetical protein [Natronosalvus halobius]|uniref:hypothetical protein n=1 Tax=Natronosalvus halobius TaxID=2953746 RepID=UPI00209DCAA7|nr:hypothetical protein [Natronosalvus halobius]USZ71069.1 hypothetical protein NGM15_13380 [Natronosalvus halobius]
MRLNRRNVLVGLGTIVAGGGGALATGAFSSVEATREVSIETAGDTDGALIGINVTGDLAGTTNDTISFDLTNDINLDAVTRFNGALTITNNREIEGGEIDIEIHIDETDAVTDVATDDGGMQFEVTTDGDQNNVSSNGGSVTFDVVFGLDGFTSKEGVDGANGADDEIPETITIIANDSDSTV